MTDEQPTELRPFINAMVQWLGAHPPARGMVPSHSLQLVNSITTTGKILYRNLWGALLEVLDSRVGGEWERVALFAFMQEMFRGIFHRRLNTETGMVTPCR